MRDIEVKRATAFPGVPTMWIAIASLPDLESRDLSSLVSCGSGGAPLPVEVAQDLRAQGRHEAQERLGHDRDLLARHRPSAGRAGQAGLDRADAAGHRTRRGCRWTIPAKLMPIGEVGEIRIRGPNVTKGYWNRPQETAEAFVGDRFLTGDIGYMDARRLFLSGRSQEGHDHLRRLQRLSADDRAGDLHPSGGAGSDRDRHPRRLPRRGGEGLHQAARRRRRRSRSTNCAPSSTGKLGKHEIAGRARFRRRTAAHLGRQAVAPRTARAATIQPRPHRPNNNNSQQEVVHDRRRDRFHRPHPDRQGLSRRAQRHRRRDAARSRHRRSGRARQGRSEGGRGRGDGRGHAAGRDRRQHRPQGAAPRRPSGHRRRHHHRPAMRLGPAGDRACRALGDLRRRRDRGRRRRRVDQPGAERSRQQVSRPGSRRCSRSRAKSTCR